MHRLLILVRHAKSSWDQAGLADFDRPLNPRGEKNAPEMGKRLAKSGFTVDKIVSSPATRAITTAKLIAEEIDYDTNQISKKPDIYEAGLNTLISIVTSLNSEDRSVMLVGHNPGFTYLCNYLCNAQIDNMPTCSIAKIRFENDHWDSITEHSGELIDFDFPKNKLHKNK